MDVSISFPKQRRLTRRALAVAAAIVSGGCQFVTESERTPNAPAAFSGSGTAAVPDRWWQAFADKQLDRAEEQALSRNFDLESSWQRLRQAQALADREASGRFPDLDALADGSTTRGDRSTDALGLGLSASYEVDLWGRIQSQTRAEQLRAKASLADYRTAALTLSAEVARTWYALVAASSQRDLIRNQIATNDKVLRQLRVRLKQGQGGAVDALRQEQLLRATKEQLTVAEANIGVLSHRLNVLQGLEPAKEMDPAARNLPALPPLPDAGLPVELLQRRPDVMRSFYALRAAEADLAAAISNRFPRLSIEASLSTTNRDASDLFDDWLTTLAGNLVGPVIDGGERRAEVNRAEARRAELLADYRQAMLEAIQQVEDSLVLEREQRNRITEVHAQLKLAARSYQRLLTEYLNGASDFIDVLTSLTDQQELQRDLVTARRNLIEFRIGLYRSLAGGFHTSREP